MWKDAAEPVTAHEAIAIRRESRHLNVRVRNGGAATSPANSDHFLIMTRQVTLQLATIVARVSPVS